MKKKYLPVLVIIGLILIIVLGIFISSLIKKYTPTKEREDLDTFYNITSENQVAIIMNYEVLDEYATLIDGNVYLDYSFVHDFLNSRFYWDTYENVLLYATADNLITAYAESTSYLVTKSSVDFGRTIVKASAESAWIDLEFVKQFSDFRYSYAESPNRIVITNLSGNVDMASMKKSTALRHRGGIKSPILADLEKGAEVTVLQEEDTWIKVMTEDGIIGYVRSNTLSDITTVVNESEFPPERFAHITKDYKICMAWHQVMERSDNSNLTNVLSSVKGLNVISPTWFRLKDNEGNIQDISDSSYVKYCHQHNMEVWALVTNVDSKDIDTAAILTHTSTRQNLVNQLISAAIAANLDGINVDLESLDGSRVGDAYIQFIRELSYKCHNNGLVLSVDNYVPSDYTAFYNRSEQANFADYVVIMGYDEHYAGSEDAGSTASLSWVRESVENTLKEVPADQTILAMPFYTRVWTLTPQSNDPEAEVIYDISSKAYGMRAAAQFVEGKGEKIWYESCGQYYVEYKTDNVITKVWLEDTTSAEKRLQLLNEYQLAGGSFWKLGQESSDIWDTVIKYIN